MKQIAAATALALALTGCGGSASSSGDGETVSRADFGEEWPLTVDSGELRCEGAGAATITADGTTYALNGTATSMNAGEDIDPIWEPNPDLPGAKKNIGPLIDRALALCE
jgi:hypothetical protein